MKKLLIFDFDGVILDSIKIVEENLYKLYPKLTSQAHRKLIEGNFHEELKKFKEMHGYQDLMGEAAEKHKQEYTKRKLESELYPGIRELLEELHKEKFILVLNTSAWERNSLPMLEKNNLMHLFDFLATAEISKDKVKKFELIEQRYETSAGQTLFITDTLGDLREADKAGIPTVCVTWGAHEKERFLLESHKNLIEIVNNPNELLKAINSYFNRNT